MLAGLQDRGVIRHRPAALERLPKLQVSPVALAPLDDGRAFTLGLFEEWFDEEVGLLAEVPNIAEAARLMHNMIVADDLVEFLTLPAYELLD